MKVDVAASAGEAHPSTNASAEASDLVPRTPGARWAFAGVVVAIAAGVVLRFAARSDLWLDEALTVDIARLPLDQIRSALVRDGAPPLYYVLLHGWIQVFGAGDVAVRALSGLFGVATILVVYQAGRRIAADPARSRGVAAAAAVIVATSPYAVHYSTETRMYTLTMLLVALGVLVGIDAWREPTFLRLVAVALVGAGLLYTLYWSIFLLGIVGLGLLGLAVRGDDRARDRARRLVVALAGSVFVFIPWLPTLRDQLAHTGTPWDAPASLVPSTARTVLAFGGGMETEGWLLAPLLLGLAVLAVTARAVDGRRIELDLRTVPGVRALAATGAAVLLVGVGVSQLADTGMQDRYAAVVFPLAALVAAFGLLAFADRRIRAGVLVAVAVLGLAGSIRTVRASRTASGAIADTLRDQLAAGDLVVYCPDQLGPATARLLPATTRQVVFPDLAGPRFVDWRDYADRNAAASPTEFTRRVLGRAGTGRIWLVWSPGFRTLDAKCERVVDALGTACPTTADVRSAAGPNGERVDLRRFDP